MRTDVPETADEQPAGDLNAGRIALGKLASATASKPVGRMSIFAYDLIVVAVLIVVGFLYAQHRSLLDWGGDPIKLAVEGMWFGALGGVIISLKGVYEHAYGVGGWDHSYNLWHFGRPLSGAIAGLMTIVLLKVINATGTLSQPVVYAAAFIFGTQERRFFNLLYEVARLIVQVPEEAKAQGLKLTGIQPPQGAAGSVVVVTGQGIRPHTAIKLGGAAIGNPIVSADGQSVAGLIPSRPAGAETVDVIASDDTGASFTLTGAFKFTD